ncbi:MAG: hypothetical protein AB7U05_11515 [Mangrovibacterium sp.]
MDPILYKFDEEGAAIETAALNSLNLKFQEIIDAFIGLDPGLSLALEDLKFLMTVSNPTNVFLVDGSGEIFASAFSRAQVLFAQQIIGTNSIGGFDIDWNNFIKVVDLPNTSTVAQACKEAYGIIQSSFDNHFSFAEGKTINTLLDLFEVAANTVSIVAGTTDSINEAYKNYAVDVDQAARLTAVQDIATALNATVALIPGGGLLDALGDVSNFIEFDELGALIPKVSFVETGLFESTN